MPHIDIISANNTSNVYALIGKLWINIEKYRASEVFREWTFTLNFIDRERVLREHQLSQKECKDDALQHNASFLIENRPLSTALSQVHPRMTTSGPNSKCSSW